MSRAVSLRLPIIVVVLSCTQRICAAYSLETYPVDWSLVPPSPETPVNLTSNCICALLAGACTPNCCCDPACPASVVAEFRAADSCLPEGPPPEQLAYCTPDQPFAKVSRSAEDSCSCAVVAVPRHTLGTCIARCKHQQAVNRSCCGAHQP